MSTSKNIWKNSQRKHSLKRNPYGIIAVILMPQIKCPQSEQGTAYSMPCLQEVRSRKNVDTKDSSEMEDSVTPSSSAPFTRSATESLTKTHCFFCQTDEGQNLFTVRTENAGNALRQAVQISQDQVLMTRQDWIMRSHQVMLMRLMWDTTKHAGHDMCSTSWGKKPALKPVLQRLTYPYKYNAWLSW